MGDVITNLFRNSKSGTVEDPRKIGERMVMSDNAAHAAADADEQTILENTMLILDMLYPRPVGLPHWWAVQVSGGLVLIRNLSLSGTEGYVIHRKTWSREKVIKAGGEILERFGISRVAYSADYIAARHNSVRLDLKAER